MIKSITQQGPSGCAPACVAQLLGTSYSRAVKLFKSGKAKEIFKGFYCKEIVTVLRKKGFDYNFEYINKRNSKKIYKNGTIVFIKRTEKYPQGHYLIRFNNLWMDPWINMPKMNPAKSGFRKKLPGKSIYAILRTDYPTELK